MWRQLLRDSETSVPGPRGKKGGAKKEAGRGGAGREGRTWRPPEPRSLGTGLSFWKERADSVNFSAKHPPIPLWGAKRGPARGLQDGKPPGTLPGDPGATEAERPGEGASRGSSVSPLPRPEAARGTPARGSPVSAAEGWRCPWNGVSGLRRACGSAGRDRGARREESG